MTPELANPEYRYLGNDTIYFQLTLNIRGENQTILDSKQFSASVSLLRPDWRSELGADITAQITAHLTKAVEIQQAVTSAFPGAATFHDAAVMVLSDITEALTSAV